ncbi:MAG: SpoIIE family protein phosphatase [Bacteroidetes bacterium]|nr:SpoIIE family protein phosphatase [Bacteroidota bacterium]
MKKYYQHQIKLLIICFFILNIINAQTNEIDSLLFKVQKNEINEEVALKTILLPYDKVVNNLNKSYSLYQLVYQSNIFKNNNQNQAELIEKLALVSYLKGNFYESFELHKKSIKLFELSNDKRQKANAMVSMAYQSKNRNLNNSIVVMYEAIQILKETKSLSDLSTALDNYGVLFEFKGELDSALHYYFDALKLKESIADSVAIPYSLNNIAGIYFMKNKYNEGLNYIEKSNLIRKNLNDFIGIAWNEFSLGEMYIKSKDFNKAESHVRHSLKLSINKSYPDLISKNAKLLSEILYNQQKYDSAYHYFNLFHVLNDSIYNSNKQSQLLEMESIYESEKKSLRIKVLNDENSLHIKEIEKKRAILYFFIILSLILVFTGVIIYKAYKQKNKANLIIIEQKKEVESQKATIEEHQKEILDSIHYAKRIQNTLLANHDFLNENISNNFVYFNPKDIVSGDFYWATKHGDNFYLAVCDSTGHGVPGAFMSLLNIGFLSEAINEKNITETNLIFEYVRERLISSVSKEGQKDGFDGIIVRFNQSTKEITYTAAHNAPILISNNELIELQKDKMPVGIGERSENFTCHKLQVKQGDMLYLYTDGYADQFGGPKGKKFKYKPLNELLLSISNKTLSEQKQELETNFKNWKGDLEQVDDVCVFGIRI